MTGEITLRGEVTAIGGLKEKLLAALRGGIKTVLIPEENAKDLQDIPENVKNGLEIVPVKWIDKVLEIALEKHARRRCPTKRSRRPQRRWPNWRKQRAATSRPKRFGRSIDVSSRLREPRKNAYIIRGSKRGNSSVGRAQPCQG